MIQNFYLGFEIVADQWWVAVVIVLVDLPVETRHVVETRHALSLRVRHRYQSKSKCHVYDWAL